MKKTEYEVIIIGAGMAGMTAAIYLKRANVNVLLLEKSAPGGQMNRSNVVENYPGFTKIDGPSLSMNVYEQVKNLDIDYAYGNVIDIIDDEHHKIVRTEDREYTCKGIIIATGRIPKKLGLPKEEKLIGHGISWCATCDGAFFKDKSVCVIGGGNSAFEESIYLSEICKQVLILNRSDQLRADKILIEEAKQKENIEIWFQSQIKELDEKEGKLVGIKIQKDDKIIYQPIDGIFINIGSLPDLNYLCHLDIKLENNYIVVNEHMKTNIEGIYACGDVIRKDVYQIATAASEGAIAAIHLKKDLKKL